MNHSYLNNCFDEPRLVKSTGDESQIAHKFIKRKKTHGKPYCRKIRSSMIYKKRAFIYVKEGDIHSFNVIHLITGIVVKIKKYFYCKYSNLYEICSPVIRATAQIKAFNLKPKIII